MSQAPELSVIIPARNAAGTIGQLLSALHESPIGVPFEVVVALDRCSDATAEVCRQHPGVRTVPSAAPGVAAARHQGACAARGDVLVFLDADTVMDGRLLGEMLDCWRRRDGHWALHGDYEQIPANTGFGPKFLALKWYYISTERHLRMRGVDCAPLCAFGGGPAMISKQDYEACRAFDDVRYKSSGGEEFEAGLRISRICPVWVCSRFNVRHHYRNVFKVFPTLVRRTYNFAMILHGLGRADRAGLDFAADATERLKLLLVFLGCCTAVLCLFLPRVGALLAILFVAGYVAADWRFLSYLRREAGWPYVLPGMLQDWLLLLAKGLGVLLAYANILLLRRMDFRF